MSQKNQGIILNQEEFVALDQLIGKLPTALGIHFVDFFRLVSQKRNVEQAQFEKEKEEREKLFENAAVKQFILDQALKTGQFTFNIDKLREVANQNNETKGKDYVPQYSIVSGCCDDCGDDCANW